ncbi:flagellar hook protein FlgE [Aquibium sp. ELW1220]|jgi:flagellar hook protein FlgE|uniref:flagellar hook protein FlgE n=1 Tax=Aquibium sp. ELW1220 TaxID=2976766 RepID=UPI0025B19D7F|nr:flagellar hook protein FlgE [Aquibium sp. ELW1220]MDN2580755.1 flagellar hook protein FlgE [Aquibium sp. ELW1220]
MSLYGMMRTGVSGMQGQSNRLGTVADNIANAGTNGYKKSTIEFSTLVIGSSEGYYSSGGIVSDVRASVSRQGVIQYTPSATDLAIEGNGFFVVQDESGEPFLTRAGSFVPDDQGRLVNAAGFYLLGYSFANGDPSPVANSFAGLQPVTVVQQAMSAVPTTAGSITANLPANADDVAAAQLPSTNAGGAEYTNKTSLVVYDSLGGEVLLDIYYSKTADNEWEISIFNQADGTANTGFPYASGPLASDTLIFDGTNGQLDVSSITELAVPVPGGETLTLDLSQMSQLATSYTPGEANVNGSAASAVKEIKIGEDGTVYARYENGTMQALYKIPLANVRSPDQLIIGSGNVFSQSPSSGDVFLGFADSGGFGSISSGALEASNVDIGEELTAMIEAQRSYTANSKVFQTGSELMDILVNLKR